MRHRGRRLVADPPARGSQTPHQVHVLAEPQRLVEAARGSEALQPDGQGGARHVGHPGEGPDRRRPGTEVERGVGPLVGSQAGRGGHVDPGLHPRCDRRRGRVCQMAHQRFEPARLRDAAGVHEDDERPVPGESPPSRVARCGRATRRLVAPHASAPAVADHRHRIYGSVVHHQDLHPGGRRVQSSQSPGQTLVVVPHRDDQRRPVAGLGWGDDGRSGVGQPRVHQTGGETPGPHPRADLAARGPPVDQRRPSLGEAHDPYRAAPDEQLRVRAPAVGVEVEAETGRHGCVHGRAGARRPRPGRVPQRAVIPASTGSTAPVMPLLSGPHNHAMSDAGSVGCRSRGSRWCWANSSVDASP